MSELTNENIINEIIKKPRKPRMSSIVSKAVLLKQLSKTNLIVPKEEAQQVVSGWSLDLSCPPLLEKNNVELINQFPIPTPNKEKELPTELTPSPTPTPNKKEEEEKEDLVYPPNEVVKEILFVGRCDICDVDFKSIILFNRHTGTIRHKLALHKQAHITSV